MFLLLAVLLYPAGVPAAERILVVKSGDIGLYNQALEGFKNALGAPFDTVSLDAADSLAGYGEPDVLVAIGNKALKACQKMSVRIPLVYLMTLNVDHKSMGARSYVGIDPEVPLRQQVRFLQANFPDLLPAGILTGRDDIRAEVQKVGQSARLESEWVRGSEQVPDAFQRLLRRVSSIILLPDATVLTRDTVDFLFLTSLEAGKPVLAYSEGLVRKGAAIGLMNRPESQGEIAAIHVKKGRSALLGRQEVVPGGKPEVYINENIVKTLKLNIPDNLLQNATIIR